MIFINMVFIKYNVDKLKLNLKLTLSIWPDFSANLRIFCKDPTLMYVEDGDHGFEFSSTKDERNISHYTKRKLEH